MELPVAVTGWTIAIGLVGITLIAAIILDPLVSLILHPIILSHPWPLNDDQSAKDSQRMVVFAASFNPPHKGHLVMLEYLARRYGTVWVVIGRNPDKQYQVSPEQRAQLVRTMLAERDANQSNKLFTSDKIQVKVVEGYIWRTVKPAGAEIFFRGIRTWEKDGPEERALQILNTWGPLVLGPLWWPIPTVFLQGKPEYNHISSTLVRDTCRKESDRKKCLAKLETLVPKSIAKEVATLYGKDRKKD